MRLRARPVALPAIVLGVFFLAIYVLTETSDIYQNGDTVLRYQTTASIVDHAHIWVAQPLWTDTRMAQGIGGHLYAFYAPGQVLFMVPFYVLGKAIAHHLQLPYLPATLYLSRSLDLVLGALVCVVFFLMALALGFSRGVALILTLIFGLATPAWPDAQSGLEQTQVDFFLLLSVYCMWMFVRGNLSRRRWLAGTATALGLTFFTRYDAALYVPLVALFPILLRLARRQTGILADAAVLAAGLLPWVLAVALWDWVRFGSPFLTGLHERTFGEPFLTGFGGLLLSPGKGLLWYAPTLFLLPWVLPAFIRRTGPFAFLLAAIVVFPLLFYSQVLYWHGDPAWGPRYLYTGLPYLVLPLGEILMRWRERAPALRALTLLLVAISFVVQVCAVSVTQWRFWYRLEAQQQRAADVNQWTGQPFHWGATRYHYYWNIRQAPVPIQVDDTYQVVRLSMGGSSYRLATRPDPYVSNPVDNYPVNELAFWWADTRTRLLGPHLRDGLVGAISLLFLLSAAALWLLSRGERTRDPATGPLEMARAP